MVIPLLPAELVVIHDAYSVVGGHTTLGETLVHREGKGGDTLRGSHCATLGRHEDDPVPCTRAVESCRGSVLEDSEVLDIFGWDLRE